MIPSVPNVSNSFDISSEKSSCNLLWNELHNRQERSLQLLPLHLRGTRAPRPSEFHRNNINNILVAARATVWEEGKRSKPRPQLFNHNWYFSVDNQVLLKQHLSALTMTQAICCQVQTNMNKTSNTSFIIIHAETKHIFKTSFPNFPWAQKPCQCTARQMLEKPHYYSTTKASLLFYKREKRLDTNLSDQRENVVLITFILFTFQYNWIDITHVKAYLCLQMFPMMECFCKLDLR